MKNKLIVISADALVWEDIDYMKTLPNFKKYLLGGSLVKRVKTIYPTITYPCHTSMASGVYPNKHKIFGNLEFIPGELDAPWKWFYESKDHKYDIFTAAKEAGYSTAAVYWPVTGNHPHIDYLIAEYWTQTPDDTFYDAYKRAGSSEEVLEIIEKNKEGVVLRKHPGCDEFVIRCSCDIIRKFKPDLIMLHPANIDAARHQTGIFNEKVKQSLIDTDNWIGEIMKAVEETGEIENTNLVLTSDHGLLDITRIVNLNVVLADNGLIKVAEDGSLEDWDAYVQSGGLSAMVYLKDYSNREVYEKTYKLLTQMAEDGIYGIEQVFTEKEINEKEHLGGEFAFVLESDGYTSFGDSWIRPMVKNFDLSDYRYSKATHGHLPEKGPQPVFIVKGPDFKDGVQLDTRPIVDEAPTYAALLGVELKNADGKAIFDLLK